MIPIRTSRHSVVATSAGGVRVTATVRDHVVATDQPERAGGTDTAPTPLELLSVALASCVALYVSRYCDEHGLPADEVAVEVKPFWRENPGRVGRFDVVVHVTESIPNEHRAAIEEVACKCPVHHTLTQGPELTVQLREVELAAAGA